MKKVLFLCSTLMLIFNHTHLLFAQAYDYKDIMKVKCVNEYENDKLVHLKDLDAVIFGRYPQSDTSGYVKDPIEWLVLTKDKENDKALLVSKYILSNSPSEDDAVKYKDVCVSYENSMFRKFLIDDFYNAAFTDEEKNSILDNTISYNYPYSFVVTDKVFPLNKNDVKTYLTTPHYTNTECLYHYSIPTPYALTIPQVWGELGITAYLSIRNYDKIRGKETWKNGYGQYRCIDGVFGSADGSLGIRPAIWVRLNNIINSTNGNSNEIKNGWIGNYYFENNVMYTNKWAEYNGDLYYLGPDGMMLRNQWIDNTYYVDNDGKMLRSAITPDGTLVGADGAKIQLQ